MIPKEINICHKNSIPKKIIDQVSNLNKNYKLNLFDDKNCIDFLKKNFGNKHVNCFLNIPDGPIKADFWRSCAIYEKGGFYFDVDVDHLLGIDEYLEKEASFMTSTSWDQKLLNPIILASCPKNKILRYCIDRYMDMFIKKDKYSYWGWSICGIMHEAFYELFVVDIKNDQKNMRLGGEIYQFVNEDKTIGSRLFDFTHYNGTRILFNHRKDYSECMRDFLDEN